MWECVYREGEKARSTVQEYAGTREEIQGGDAEAGENREAGSAGSRGNQWDLDREEGTGVKTGKTGHRIEIGRIAGYVFTVFGLRQSCPGSWEVASFIPTGLISVSGNTCAGSPVGTAGCSNTLVHGGAVNTFIFFNGQFNGQLLQRKDRQSE